MKGFTSFTPTHPACLPHPGALVMFDIPTGRDQKPRNRRAFLTEVAGATIGLSTLSTCKIARSGSSAARRTRVRVWCEGGAPTTVYPEDLDGAIAKGLAARPGLVVTRGRLDGPFCGLSDSDLDATDTLIWWGRLRHEEVPADRVQAVVERIRAGTLGLVALHSSFGSKPFQALMGESCAPNAWRMDGRPERVSVAAADHPIARGLAPFVIPRASMFAEPFSVPTPETVVLISSWETGETFRSCLTWTIGKGRVVYFRPGHDAFPELFHPCVRQVIANAAVWAAPTTA